MLYQPPCPLGMHCRVVRSQALDSDKKRLQAPNGQHASRDVVQFCELRPHQVRCLGCMPLVHVHCHGKLVYAPAALLPSPCPAHPPRLQRDTVEGLASKLLAELPGQVGMELSVRGAWYRWDMTDQASDTGGRQAVTLQPATLPACPGGRVLP